MRMGLKENMVAGPLAGAAGTGLLGTLAIIGPAAAAAAALAGAIGLGLAALAKFKKKQHLHHHHAYSGHGHDDHDHDGHVYGGQEHDGHGQGHGYPKSLDHGHIRFDLDDDFEFGHRKKRKAVNAAKIRRLLEVIKSEDVSGCGMKLVCELAGLSEEKLTEEGAAILSLVGPSIRPGEGLLPIGAKGDFQLARGLGERDSSLCKKQFKFCPIDGQQLIFTIVNLLP